MDRRQQVLRKKSSQFLLAQLPKADLYEAGAIRAVLRDRGFADAELALVRRLSSPRVEDRMQLINDLGVLPAGTARRWLRRLLNDADAEIRLRALTALATTNDPELFNLARKLAVSDQDVRVSELASRIMRQVR